MEENDSAIRVVIRTEPAVSSAIYDDLFNLMEFAPEDLFEFLFETSVPPSSVVRMNLPSYKYRQRNNTDECTICRRTFKVNDEMCSNTCTHSFHFDCLAEWVKHNPTCPICRTNVPTTNV